MQARKQHQRLKLTEEVLEAAEGAAARGLSESQVAEVLGISRATLLRRKRDDAAFDAAIKRVRQEVFRRSATLYLRQRFREVCMP